MCSIPSNQGKSEKTLVSLTLETKKHGAMSHDHNHEHEHDGDQGEAGNACVNSSIKRYDFCYSPRKNVELRWTVDEMVGRVTFALDAPTTGWIGLSVQKYSGQMYPADSVIGLPGATVQPYKLTNYDVTFQHVDSEQEILDASLTTHGTFSRLEFSRKLDNGGAYPLSVTETNFLGYAYSSSGMLGHHTARGSLSLKLTTGKVEAVSHPLEADYLTHGYLNIVAWCYLVPTGILTLMVLRRFNKRNKQDIKMKGVRVHWCANVSGVILCICAVLIGLFRFYDKNMDSFPVKSHTVLGLTLASVASLNVIGGIFRPGVGWSIVRRVWSFAHKNTGRILVFLTLCNVYIGLHEFDHHLDGFKKPKAFFDTKNGLMTVAVLLFALSFPTATLLAKSFVKGVKDTAKDVEDSLPSKVELVQAVSGNPIVEHDDEPIVVPFRS